MGSSIASSSTLTGDHLHDGSIIIGGSVGSSRKNDTIIMAAHQTTTTHRRPSNNKDTTTTTTEQYQCTTCTNTLAILTKLQSQTTAGLAILNDILFSTNEFHSKASLAKMKLEEARLDVDNAIDGMLLKLKDGENNNIVGGGEVCVGGGCDDIITVGVQQQQQQQQAELLLDTSRPALLPGDCMDTMMLWPLHILSPATPHLTITPTAYLHHLHSNELTLETSEDVIELVEECLEVLASVKEGVAISEEDALSYNVVFEFVVEGMEEEFCRVVLDRAMGNSMGEDSLEEEEGIVEEVQVESTNSENECGENVEVSKECKRESPRHPAVSPTNVAVDISTSSTSGNPFVDATASPTSCLNDTTYNNHNSAATANMDSSNWLPEAMAAKIMGHSSPAKSSVTTHTSASYNNATSASSLDENTYNNHNAAASKVVDSFNWLPKAMAAKKIMGHSSPAKSSATTVTNESYNNAITALSNDNTWYPAEPMPMQNTMSACSPANMSSVTTHRTSVSNDHMILPPWGAEEPSNGVSSSYGVVLNEHLNETGPYNGMKAREPHWSNNSGNVINDECPPVWTCSICTCINPNMHLNCSACGTQVLAAPDSSMMMVSVAELELRQQLEIEDGINAEKQRRTKEGMYIMRELEERRRRHQQQQQHPQKLELGDFIVAEKMKVVNSMGGCDDMDDELAELDRNATRFSQTDETNKERVARLSAKAQLFEPKSAAGSSGRTSPALSALSPNAASFQPRAMTAQPFEPNISATAQPFQLSKLSPEKQPLEIKASLTGSSDEKSVRKSVVVEISSKKYATKTPTSVRPAVLPGMEYLVGVDDAKLEAERKARIEAKKRDKEAKLTTKEKEEEEAEKIRMAVEAEEMKKKKNIEAKKIAQKKQPEPEPEEDEMPDLDEMMAVLAMSKEDRLKSIKF